MTAIVKARDLKGEHIGQTVTAPMNPLSACVGMAAMLITAYRRRQLARRRRNRR